MNRKNRIEQNRKEYNRTEQNRIAHVSTSITTSLLQYELDSNAGELEEYTSLENIITSYKLGLKALDELDEFIKGYGNKCKYEKKDTLLYTSKECEVKAMEEEYKIRKIVTAYNFSGKDETQGKGFTDELQTLVTRWQTNNPNVKIKLHYNTQLTAGLPWLKTLQLYDSISETVVDDKFDPFPESAFVSEMMKTLEQMLKDISNPDLKERAKHTAFDYFELQAQEVLNKKNKENKTQESYNSKSLLDRIYEAAEEGDGLGSGDNSQNQEQNNNSQNQEQNQNQDQNQENPQNKNDEEEAKKREEQTKKWQKVQQWYQDNKGCRWVAKLLSVIYSNWKNQGVYKEKGIDDQSSLANIMKYIREEDKELAKEFINQMGGGLALAVMDQIKKVADANKDNKKAEENAKELVEDHKSMSEEAKMISRLGTHKNFSSLFGQKGELADDKAASKQLFDILG